MSDTIFIVSLPMDIYAENILEHFRHPRNKGTLTGATVKHEEANHACGDTVAISLQIKNGKILRTQWEGTGCAISQAAMSLLSERLVGMNIETAAQLHKKDVLELLGIPVSTRRMKCALLCLHTLKNALHIAEGGKTQNWLDTVEIDEGS